MAIVDDATKRGFAHRTGDVGDGLILLSFYPSFDALQNGDNHK
jgi:hypothetical protein